MIRDGLSRLLEARSLFAQVEVLVTNLVSDLEGDRRLLGDPQVQASDLVHADNEGVRATLPYCSQRDSASYLARLVPLVTSGRLILDS